MSNFNRYYREALIILVLISCLALLNYLIPPAWIFACQDGQVSQPELVINVSRSELEQFPPIIEALANPCRGIHPTEYTKCSNIEGMKIVNHFKALPQRRNAFWFYLNIEGELYQIHIRFENEPPPIV